MVEPEIKLTAGIDLRNGVINLLSNIVFPAQLILSLRQIGGRFVNSSGQHFFIYWAGKLRPNRFIRAEVLSRICHSPELSLDFD